MKSFSCRFRKASNLLFTCEHASARIPRSFDFLGLSLADLKVSKDWYDCLSFRLSRHLVNLSGASFIYATVSRLVIDFNRPFDFKPAKGNTFHSNALKSELLIQKNRREELIPIPANQNKGKKEINSRFRKFVQPYQKKSLDLISRLNVLHDRVFIIPVHSFEPFYNGQQRNFDIGVLVSHKFPESVRVAKRVVRSIRESSNLKVFLNKPWNPDNFGGGIFGKYENKTNLIVSFEVNNRLLKSESAIKKISRLIHTSLKPPF